MSLKYLVIYHDKCIDGITSAAVVHKYLTERCNTDSEHILYLPMNYGEGIDVMFTILKSRKVDTIYIVDFSIDIKTLHKMYEYVNLIGLYDHHASAFRMLIDEDYDVCPDSKVSTHLTSSTPPHKLLNIGTILDNSECGASLLWKELFPGTELPKLIEYVKDWDLWQKKLPDTDAVNKYLKMQEKTVVIFCNLLSEFESLLDRQRASDLGNTLLEYETQIEDSLIEAGTTPVTIDGVSGLCVNAPYTFASSIGHKLACASGTFGAVWSQMSEGVVKWSLRSIGDDCDVSKLAESMGGGGHKNASGFEMKTPEFHEEKGITIWGIDSETLEPVVDDGFMGDKISVIGIDGETSDKFPIDPAAPESESPEYFNEVVTSLEATEETEGLCAREEYND